MARNYRKERGRATEHLVAAAFAGDGWPHAEATGAGSPGRDIKGVPGVAVEVKARAKFEPMANLRQAVANAGGDIAAVVMRPVGGGPSNIDEWPAFVTFGELRSLLRQAGYGDPLSATHSAVQPSARGVDGPAAQNGSERLPSVAARPAGGGL
jgi:hypothetical protein